MSNKINTIRSISGIAIIVSVGVQMMRVGAVASIKDDPVYEYRDLFTPDRYVAFVEAPTVSTDVWGYLSYSRSDAYDQLTDCSLNSEGICIDWGDVWRFAYDCSSFEEDSSVAQEWRSEDWTFSVRPPRGAVSEYLIIARRDKYEASAMENIEMQFIWSKAKGVTELIFLGLDDQFQRKGIVNVWRALDVGFGQFEKICK